VEVGPDGKEIATMLEATAAEYHVDGLIFTPAETPAEAVIKRRRQAEGALERGAEVEAPVIIR
jgi:hypothetical protein